MLAKILNNKLEFGIKQAEKNLNRLGMPNDEQMMRAFVSFALDWSVREHMTIDRALESHKLAYDFLAHELDCRGIGTKLREIFEDDSLSFIIGRYFDQNLTDETREIMLKNFGVRYERGRDFIADLFAGKVKM